VSRFQWVWAALLAAGVVVIVVVGNPTEGHSRASFETWTVVLLVLGPALVACVIGALTASLPTMTVTEPIVIVGSVLGVVVLGEALRPGEAGWFTLAVAVTVMVVATAALARGEAATMGADEAAERTGG
jgi:drug/metabolite transporter (DMT)-like permease